MTATVIIPAVALQLAFRLWTPDTISPETEIVLVSMVKGVDPHVALAVAKAETGRISEDDGQRDRIISQGNYGRFQVRCKTWQKPLGLDSCDDLLERHRNIWAGVTILAYVMVGRKARLGGPVDWVGHYNEGMVVNPEGQGGRYIRRVKYHLRTSRKAAMRRFHEFKGW
jgi:hypothetical protein